MEIERKFYADYIPELLRGQYPCILTQYYLSTDPDLRVRSVDDKEFYLTYKSETDDPAVRNEFEVSISKSEFDKLKARCLLDDSGKELMVSKIRNKLYLQGYDKATFDIFRRPKLSGYWIEIEFDSVEEAKNFVPPDWFRAEVTDDKFYRSSNLAKLP